MHDAYSDNDDVTFHAFQLHGSTDAVLIYFSSLCNIEILDRQVLGPLLHMKSETPVDAAAALRVLPISGSNLIYRLPETIASISSGAPVLLLDGSETALSFQLENHEHRNVEEPSAESNDSRPP